MMCNTLVNQTSASIMASLLAQFVKALEKTNGPAEQISQLLTAPHFRPLTLGGIQVQEKDGSLTPTSVRMAVRKLENAEEKLLLIEVYEYFLKEKIVSEEKLSDLMQYGFAIMELADSNNRINGEVGYDLKQISKIHTVTLQ